MTKFCTKDELPQVGCVLLIGSFASLVALAVIAVLVKIIRWGFFS